MPEDPPEPLDVQAPSFIGLSHQYAGCHLLKTRKASLAFLVSTLLLYLILLLQENRQVLVALCE